MDCENACISTKSPSQKDESRRIFLTDARLMLLFNCLFDQIYFFFIFLPVTHLNIWEFPSMSRFLLLATAQSYWSSCGHYVFLMSYSESGACDGFTFPWQKVSGTNRELLNVLLGNSAVQ